MENLLTKAGGLLLMIALGYLLKRRGVFRTEDSRVLSKVIINLTLPGALIASFESFVMDVSMVSVIVTAALANVLLLFVAALLTRGRSGPIRSLYMLNLPSYNIGTFVLPIVQSFLPAEGLLAVCMFDAGNNPFNSGGSYAIASVLNGTECVRVRSILSKVLHSVPFDTFLILIIAGVAGIRFPQSVYQIAGMFGQANSVLAMLMIGMMFELKLQREDMADVLRIVGLRYAFGIAAALLAYHALPVGETARQVTALSLLAPVPSVTLAYCEKSGCKPSVVGMVHSLCIPISLICSLSLLFLWQ